jgi:hypothetical protein
MELKKIILNDEQIQNLPLFFRRIYSNDMLDQKIEDQLMYLNPNTGTLVMRNDAPNRRFGMLYDYTKIVSNINNNDE